LILTVEPIELHSQSKEYYFVIFLDSYSYYLKSFIEHTQVETECKLNYFYTDRGSKHTLELLKKYFVSKKIYHKLTNLDTFQENGLVEYMHSSILILSTYSTKFLLKH